MFVCSSSEVHCLGLILRRPVNALTTSRPDLVLLPRVCNVERKVADVKQKEKVLSPDSMVSLEF